MDAVTVIGAGLAGSEAAWQIAQRGIKVKLYEMRPDKMTPAHHTPYFAELVCSNSLRANNLENAVGLLKEEMRELRSLIMLCADENAVAAGGALAVDRTGFARAVTKRLAEHPRVEIIREEVKMLPRDGVTVLASGPLTSESLTDDLRKITGTDYLYFYDAAAPIVDGETINYDKVFWGSRYNKGTADYLNCPMNQEEYERFYQALISAEVHKLHEFEKEIYFEGCMPVEVMASRGPQTLLFGPLKPVGLADPRTNTRPYAVVQLRKDNAAGTLFNLVGFQTHLKWGEQQRVFRMIPGLEEAEFVRYGVMHRNTYINAPQILEITTQLKIRPDILIAGQISGVEGYVESAASGLISGINAARLARQQEPLIPPRNSAIGSLLYYITHASTEGFQPMNITFGLIPPWPEKIKDKKAKNLRIANRALEEIRKWKNEVI
ncbi:MAG: Methylenetetrahydrofolate--tRNA-(uracil-5-)-methyltransferase trmFO [Peptococcaceae bacterium]|nr:Methylenetetrahydrofolate--tRNA-(uracil-5-)-methyltransferase trmFO [Peptococcaceae bacterium]